VHLTQFHCLGPLSAKNCQKWWKFDKVRTKTILTVFFETRCSCEARGRADARGDAVGLLESSIVIPSFIIRSSLKQSLDNAQCSYKLSPFKASEPKGTKMPRSGTLHRL